MEHSKVTLSKQTANYLKCMRKLHELEEALENALTEQFGKEEAEEMMQQQVRRSLENPLAVIESLLMDSINENLEKEPAEAGAEIY
jgi:hypothetical protein